MAQPQGSSDITRLNSIALNANAFKAFTLAKSSSSTSGQVDTLDKENLEVRRAMNSMYHFAQTKSDVIPAMLKSLPDFSNMDIVTVDRIGKLDWSDKTVSGQATPFSSQETDKRGFVSTIIHAATTQDLDIERKQRIKVLPEMMVEWTYALSRKKERYAQAGLVQDVITLASDIQDSSKGFATSVGVASLPDTSRMVLVSDPEESTAADLAVGSFNKNEDLFIDTLVDFIEGCELDLDNIFVVVPHNVRLQFKGIASFRNKENTQVLGSNENVKVMRYKDLVWVFLKPSAYSNQKTAFNNKYYDKDGKVYAASATGRKQLTGLTADSNEGYATALIVDRSGAGWASDSGANAMLYGQLERNSFAKVVYMKTGFACGRIDETKVYQLLFNLKRGA